MSLTHAEWIRLTKATGRSRSQALKDVDDLLLRYEASGYSNTKLLNDLSKAFKTWSNTKMRTDMVGMMPVTTYKTVRGKKKDATTGKNALELMRDFLTGQATSNVVHRVEVTGLHERVAIVEATGTLMTQAEGAKVQEAIRTLQVAVRKARDTVIGAKSPGPERVLYEKWFGAYDTTRCNTVRDRFQILDRICADKGIVFTDGRDDAANRSAYAWAYPGEERNFPNMWLGDGFFESAIGLGRGRQAAGDTLGTLVHELTHACFNTGDVPEEAILDVTPCDAYGSPINYGAVPVCNDPKNDCRLAQRRPAEAIRNADNYGEFVVEAHTGLLYNYVWP
jgi:hypothetical protein